MSGGTASTIRSETLSVRGATLGPDSPLPAFGPLRAIPDVHLSHDLPAAMRERAAYGRLANPLPYPVQNGYAHSLIDVDLPVVILDNGILSATVCPSLGGRILSLVHQPSGRELLHRNDILQYANFGLTDAWFAGGIEWNLGSTGHSAMSCRPMFCAVVETDSDPILRLWEWERTRDQILQVDLTLPAGSSFLFASTRVRNPDPVDKPLYWWTNIATVEREDTRVLAPATSAWRSAYDGSLEKVAVPFPDDDLDVSYSLRSANAADYFFDVGEAERGFVCTIDRSGHGFVQTSTPELSGRKLFCWGNGPGGARWQEWLSGRDARYNEIQAGLAPTQSEHLRLGAGGDISWTEAYGPIQVDPVEAHGAWDTAVAAVSAALELVLDGSQVAARHEQWLRTDADRVPGALIGHGSGFGDVEIELRRRSGTEVTVPATPFSAQDDGAHHLLSLLRDGSLTIDPADVSLLMPPVSPAWSSVYEQAESSWWIELARGITRFNHGDDDGADRAYAASYELAPTPWALRGRALVARALGRDDSAAELMTCAFALAPDCYALAVETADVLLDADQPARCTEVLDAVAGPLRANGRLRLQRIRALVARGDRDAAAALLAEPFEVADLREGESTLDDLWRQVKPDQPVPRHLDFRMRRDEGGS